jgi:hypothetical protein
MIGKRALGHVKASAQHYFCGEVGGAPTGHSVAAAQ